MFIAYVTGNFYPEEPQPQELYIPLNATTLEDAKNELFSHFSLIPGCQGYYRESDVKKATLYEVASTLDVDIDAQREAKALAEAEMLAEQEHRREMEQLNRSRKKHKR